MKKDQVVEKLDEILKVPKRIEARPANAPVFVPWPNFAQPSAYPPWFTWYGPPYPNPTFTYQLGPAVCTTNGGQSSITFTAAT